MKCGMCRFRFHSRYFILTVIISSIQKIALHVEMLSLGKVSVTDHNGIIWFEYT